jgi:hypothetical protein
MVVFADDLAAVSEWDLQAGVLASTPRKRRRAMDFMGTGSL